MAKWTGKASTKFLVRMLKWLKWVLIWMLIGPGPHGRWKWLLALSTILLTLLFPPFYCFFLAPVAIVPLCVCILRRPLKLWPLGMYYRMGLWFFLLSLYWLIPVDLFGYLALCGFLAFYFVVFAIVLNRLVIQMRLPATIAVPLAWTAVEYVRATFLLGGFPWLLLGNSLAPMPVLLQTADIFGVWGLTFLVAMLNGFVVDVLRLPLRQWSAAATSSQLAVIQGEGTDLKPARKARWSPVIGRLALAVAAMMVIALGYSVWRMDQQTTRPGPLVAVIQANYPQAMKDDPKKADEVFETHRRLAVRAATMNPKPDIIVWPETMVPQPINPEFIALEKEQMSLGNPDLHGDALKDRSILEGICDEYQVAQLLGYGYVAPKSAGWKNYHDLLRENRTQLMEPLTEPGAKRVTQDYAKVHLVPFGEFVPFQDVPGLGSLVLNLTPYADMLNVSAGTQWTRLTMKIPERQVAGPAAAGPETSPATPATSAAMTTEPAREYTFGTPICFEDAMPEPARRLTAPQFAGGKKADFLLNVSNDGWFQWVELEEHLQACQIRAVENRVPIARAVNTGNSGFIDSNGRVLELIAIGAEGTIARQLQLDSRVTIYARIGDLLPIVCGVMTVFLVGWTFVRPRRGGVMGREDGLTKPA